LAVSFGTGFGQTRQMSGPLANPVVHLELRTANLPRACAFYTELLGWKAETVHAGPGSYLALELAHGIGGGVVEREGAAAGWLPYVEVTEIAEATERGRALGAAVVLEPREGPAGWRGILAVPDGAEVALWQPKI
jgi:predicted enzyme related to lactoylglutathione lyase